MLTTNAAATQGVNRHITVRVESVEENTPTQTTLKTYVKLPVDGLSLETATVDMRQC